VLTDKHTDTTENNTTLSVRVINVASIDLRLPSCMLFAQYKHISKQVSK